MQACGAGNDLFRLHRWGLGDQGWTGVCVCVCGWTRMRSERGDVRDVGLLGASWFCGHARCYLQLRLHWYFTR
jgi:hypothetical protein